MSYLIEYAALKDGEVHYTEQRRRNLESAYRFALELKRDAFLGEVTVKTEAGLVCAVLHYMPGTYAYAEELLRSRA